MQPFKEDSFIQDHLTFLEKDVFIPEEYNRWRGLSNKKFPGFFHINRMEDASIVYLTEEASELFGIPLEEIRKMGPEFLAKVMHPEDVERCLELLAEFVQEGDTMKTLTYFQRIRLNIENDEYFLCLTSVKLDLENQQFLCISNFTDQLPVFTTKISQALNENKETKKMAAAYLQLTKREKEIITYLVKGYLAKQAADELHISTRTVEQHKKNIYKKLNIQKLNQLIHFAHLFKMV